MRIDQTTPQTSLAQADSAKSLNPQAAQADATDLFGPAGIHTPSSDLVQLLNLSGQVPSVRPEVLHEVAQRMAAGEYRTPQARDAVVQAILGSQPS